MAILEEANLAGGPHLIRQERGCPTSRPERSRRIEMWVCRMCAGPHDSWTENATMAPVMTTSSTDVW